MRFENLSNKILKYYIQNKFQINKQMMKELTEYIKAVVQRLFLWGNAAPTGVLGHCRVGSVGSTCRVAHN